MAKHFKAIFLVLLLALLQWLALVAALAPIGRAERSHHGSLRSHLRIVRQGHGHWSNLSATFGEESLHGLTERNYCESGYGLCPDGVHCCPIGDTCNPYGCCRAGKELCGTDTCYNPSTEICCSGGYSCELGEVCVGSDYCCPSGTVRCGTAHCYDPDTEICCTVGIEDQCCGSGIFSTEYETTDYLTTEYSATEYSVTEYSITEYSITETTYQSTEISCITITTEAHDAEDEDFECDEITVVNQDNATMELGSNCVFTYYPPPDASTTSTDPSVHDAAARRGHLVHPRATQVPNVDIKRDEVYTSVNVVALYADEEPDCTITVEASESPSGFSCYPMTVSDGFGDQLVLDEDCHFALSLNFDNQTSTTESTQMTHSTHTTSPTHTASPTATASPTQTAGPNGGLSGANAKQAPKGFIVAMVVFCVMAITLTWT